MKRQVHIVRKYLQNIYLAKGFYPQYMGNSYNTRRKTSQYKNGQKEDKQMASKHIRSTQLQGNANRDQNETFIRMATFCCFNDNTKYFQDIEQPKLFFTAGANVK